MRVSEIEEVMQSHRAVNSRSIAEDCRPWEDARRQELRSHLACLPDAREYAYELPLPVAEALLRASPSRSFMRGASPADLKLLRAYGLAECGGTCLTNFGIAVRREIGA